MTKNTVKIVLMSWLALFCSLSGFAMDKLPDTGQTNSYTETFGEDADYNKHPLSYSRLGYGGVVLPEDATIADGWIMTRDNVTGLIWENKTNDGTIHRRDFKVTWCNRNPETNGGVTGSCTSYWNTESFIEQLNTEQFGGFSDWRLPTVKELSSIVKFNQTSPFIDTVYFPNTADWYYWTATPYKGAFADNAWRIEFNTGSQFVSGTEAVYHLRAVRDDQ